MSAWDFEERKRDARWERGQGRKLGDPVPQDPPKMPYIRCEKWLHTLQQNADEMWDISDWDETLVRAYRERPKPFRKQCRFTVYNNTLPEGSETLGGIDINPDGTSEISLALNYGLWDIYPETSEVVCKIQKEVADRGDNPDFGGGFLADNSGGRFYADPESLNRTLCFVEKVLALDPRPYIDEYGEG